MSLEYIWDAPPPALFKNVALFCWLGPIRNVNYDRGPKRCGELWGKKWDEKEVENGGSIKYSDYHTMSCETSTNTVCIES